MGRAWRGRTAVGGPVALGKASASRGMLKPRFEDPNDMTIRPMTMGTRCSKVIFPNYSTNKPAEDTLVPQLWGTQEKNVCFFIKR